MAFVIDTYMVGVSKPNDATILGLLNYGYVPEMTKEDIFQCMEYASCSFDEAMQKVNTNWIHKVSQIASGELTGVVMINLYNRTYWIADSTGLAYNAQDGGYGLMFAADLVAPQIQDSEGNVVQLSEEEFIAKIACNYEPPVKAATPFQ